MGVSLSLSLSCSLLATEVCVSGGGILSSTGTGAAESAIKYPFTPQKAFLYIIGVDSILC